MCLAEQEEDEDCVFHKPAYQRRHQGFGFDAERPNDLHVATAQSRSVCFAKLITQVAINASEALQLEAGVSLGDLSSTIQTGFLK
jgi:hypothetical protein